MDTKTKHTPGPRTVRERQLHPGIVAEVRDPEGVVIATMVYRGEDAEGIEATRADAKLDAAAPEGLAAAREAAAAIFAFRTSGTPDYDRLQRAQEALDEFVAKAEGSR